MIPAHLHTRKNVVKSRSIDDIYTGSEFLRLARSHFTALEVTDLKTAEFFDGEHKKQGFFEKRASDPVTLIR